MKKILLTLSLSVLGAISCYAQHNEAFLGIPLDGTIKEFASKMKAKGFSYEQDLGDFMRFNGTVDGESVEVTVYHSSQSETVYCVTVTYPVDFMDGYKATGRWHYVEAKFNEVNARYRAKFQSIKEVHYWENGSDPDNIFDAIDGKCHYKSTYSTPGGTIEVITSGQNDVSVLYIDKVNADLSTKEQKTIR